MDKRKLHYFWRRLNKVSYWYFFIAFVVTLAVGVIALRNNNMEALELRERVIQADKEDGDVEAALRDLREFVHSHMNADLTTGTGIQHPVQLVHRYERLVNEERERVEEVNEQIYPTAQNICEQQYPGAAPTEQRINCIEDYVLQHGEQEERIPEALYKFDFASPRWSPDLAGWSLLASALFFILFITRFGLELWLKIMIKRSQNI